MAELHEIDPDGDVELILQCSGQLASSVDNVFEDIRAPSRLGYWRSEWNDPRPQCMKIRGEKVPGGGWPLHSRVHDEVSPDKEPEHENSESDEEVENALAVSKADTESNPNSSKKCVRIRVSSRHLALASSYFRRNFKSGMLESNTPLWGPPGIAHAGRRP